MHLTHILAKHLN